MTVEVEEVAWTVELQRVGAEDEELVYPGASADCGWYQSVSGWYRELADASCEDESGENI
jgi:hypothetical protein